MQIVGAAGRADNGGAGGAGGAPAWVEFSLSSGAEAPKP